MGSSCCRPQLRIQWSDLLLDHKDPFLFTKSQWFNSRFCFLIYRVLVSCYFLAWLAILCAVRIPDRGSRTFIYLSEWSFVMLNCYFTVAALGMVYTYGKHKERQTRQSLEDSASDSSARLLPNSESITANTITNQLPIYLRISWCLFSINTGLCTMITMIYWPILFSSKGQSKLNEAIEFNVHLVSTILLFVDLCLSALPIRFIHCIYPLLFGVTYMLFSVVYWAAGGVTQNGGTAIYPILDWEDKPLQTIGWILIAGVLGILGYSLFYGVYRLRVKIFVKYCRRNEPVDQVGADYNEV